MTTCPKCTSIFSDPATKCPFCGCRIPQPFKLPDPKELPTDPFYEAVADEIIRGEIDKGMWLKAFAESGGSETGTKSLYVRYRAEQYRKAAKK